MALKTGTTTITAASDQQTAQTEVTITSTETVLPSAVTDLAVAAMSDSSATLSFIEVDDGARHPSDYEIRYAVASIEWTSATKVRRGTCSTPVLGVDIGDRRTCTALGLARATKYEFQLVPFRGSLDSGTAVLGPPSNVAAGTTTGSVSLSVASVVISPAAISGVIGQTAQLTATTKDANGNVLTGRTVTWSSGGASVATVSATGLVTFAAAGTTTVSATSEGRTGQAQITVSAPPPAAVADLAASATSDSSVTLTFTEVSDGTGQPASYDVRYAVAPISWSAATGVTRHLLHANPRHYHWRSPVVHGARPVGRHQI